MKIQHDKLTYVDEILFSFFEKWGNLLIFRDIGRKIHCHASSANMKSHGPPLPVKFVHNRKWNYPQTSCKYHQYIVVNTRKGANISDIYDRESFSKEKRSSFTSNHYSDANLFSLLFFSRIHVVSILSLPLPIEVTSYTRQGGESWETGLCININVTKTILVSKKIKEGRYKIWLQLETNFKNG